MRILLLYFALFFLLKQNFVKNSTNTLATFLNIYYNAYALKNCRGKKWCTLDNGIACGFLLREINFVWERIAKNLLDDTNLNWTQMGTLSILKNTEGNELSLKSLEKSLGLTQSAVARMAGQLVEKGYVEYTPDETDRRAKRIRLLEKGTQSHQTFVDVLKGRELPLFRGMSPGEALLFEKCLGQVLENSTQFCKELYEKKAKK